ncbi:MAG: hypothetical protein QM770_23380 [Tepidisphaeraceae bacterium]
MYLPMLLAPIWAVLVLRAIGRAARGYAPLEPRRRPGRFRPIGVMLAAYVLWFSGVGQWVGITLARPIASPIANHLWNEVPASDIPAYEGWRFVGSYFGYVRIKPSGVYVTVGLSTLKYLPESHNEYNSYRSGPWWLRHGGYPTP